MGSGCWGVSGGEWVLGNVCRGVGLGSRYWGKDVGECVRLWVSESEYCGWVLGKGCWGGGVSQWVLGRGCWEVGTRMWIWMLGSG